MHDDLNNHFRRHAGRHLNPLPDAVQIYWRAHTLRSLNRRSQRVQRARAMLDLARIAASLFAAVGFVLIVM